jgi:RNA recognition motif-containing protein
MDQSSFENESLRLFIGGLGPEVAEEDLQVYFLKFGQVSDCEIIRDAPSSSSRGYGFVSCENKKTYSRILRQKAHHVGSNLLIVKRAYLKRSDEGQEVQATRKLYVGGFGDDVKRGHLQSYFSGYGKVSNVYMFFDSKGTSGKNFAYIVFDNLESAQAVIDAPSHSICGTKVCIKNYKKNIKTSSRRKTAQKEASAKPQEFNLASFEENKSYPVEKYEFEQNEDLAAEGSEFISQQRQPAIRLAAGSDLRIPHGTFTPQNNSSTVQAGRQHIYQASHPQVQGRSSAQQTAAAKQSSKAILSDFKGHLAHFVRCQHPGSYCNGYSSIDGLRVNVENNVSFELRSLRLEAVMVRRTHLYGSYYGL